MLSKKAKRIELKRLRYNLKQAKIEEDNKEMSALITAFSRCTLKISPLKEKRSRKRPSKEERNAKKKEAEGQHFTKDIRDHNLIVATSQIENAESILDEIDKRFPWLMG